MSDGPITASAVCAKCGAEPIYQDKPLSWFVGKYVKKPFEVKDAGSPGGPSHERMWVLITHVDESLGELVGILHNSPLCDCGAVFGDHVAAKKAEIIGVES